MQDEKPNSQPPATNTGGDMKDKGPVQAPGTEVVDTYLDKLIKFIPGDLVAAYLALDGLMRESSINAPDFLYWVIFVSLLILTPLYVVYRPTHGELSGHSKRFHAIAASIAFSVWVFALGGPFAVTWPDLYRPLYGSVLLVITTLTIPVIEKIVTKTRPFR